jgi:hypothetical protein
MKPTAKDDATSGDRVTFDEKGELDEVVGTGFAHLERMGRNHWFLLIGHKDGTETAIWFDSPNLKKPFWEERPARKEPSHV